VIEFFEASRCQLSSGLFWDRKLSDFINKFFICVLKLGELKSYELHDMRVSINDRMLGYAGT